MLAGLINGDVVTAGVCSVPQLKMLTLSNASVRQDDPLTGLNVRGLPITAPSSVIITHKYSGAYGISVKRG